jgi:hypothetical protein
MICFGFPQKEEEYALFFKVTNSYSKKERNKRKSKWVIEKKRWAFA